MSLPLFPDEGYSTLHFEQRAVRNGFRVVAGIDEAGRGPLAGPVVAAAVILPEHFELPGLTDSKKLSHRQREYLYPLIRRQAITVGVGVIPASVIDATNILVATLRGMSLAVSRLDPSPDHLLIDGITPLPLPISQQTLKQGDSRSLSIAAASVVAKVLRDRIMTAFDKIFPGYGFEGHKGYGTRDHLEAIARLGPSSIHRKTFRGVREHLERA